MKKGNLFSGIDKKEIEKSRGKSVFEVGRIVSSDYRPFQLFEGFSRMKAITYSFSLPFLEKIAKKFEAIEVIVGSPKTLNVTHTAYGLSVCSPENEIEEEVEIIRTLQRTLKTYPDLRSVRIRISVGKPTHEKLYLLEGAGDRRRAVFGSGNLSSMAFLEGQDEGFYFSDDPETWALLQEVYERNLSQAADFDPAFFRLEGADENATVEIEPNHLPIVMKTREFGSMEVVSKNDPGLSRAIKVFAPRLPPSVLPERVTLKVLSKVAGDYLHRLRPASKEREDFLAIRFDFDEGVIRKGEAILGDFTTTADELQHDIDMLGLWFESYRKSNFLGDKEFAIRGFELLLVFSLVSPFLPVLHHVAARDGRGGFQYPLFAIVFGPSSGGKTSFLECLRPITFRIDAEIKGMKFTSLDFEKYRIASGQGLLIKDDVPKKSINSHLDAIVKKDELMKTTVMAPVIISTNKEVEGLESAILKRAIPILINTHILGLPVPIPSSRLGPGLFKTFLGKFTDHFRSRLDGKGEESHILAEASLVLASIYPGFRPFSDKEIADRRFESFRKRFEMIIAEKRRDGSIERKGKSLFVRFDAPEAASEFFSEVPEDADARIGEKMVEISVEGLDRIGLRPDLSRGFWDQILGRLKG